MTFIDDVVKGYRYTQAVSAFFDQCKKEGVDFQRLSHYPGKKPEYENLNRGVDLDSQAAFLGHMTYVISHPWRYMGGQDNYDATSLILREEVENAQRQYGQDKARELYPK